jgi:CheY-like chemotaxis protein
MSIVALVSELMTRSRVAAAAEHLGIDAELVGSAEELMARVKSAPTGLVILDLTHPGIAPMELVPKLREMLPAGANILAFGPHVHAAILAAARQAGCDRVLARGQFHSDLANILSDSGA